MYCFGPNRFSTTVVYVFPVVLMFFQYFCYSCSSPSTSQNTALRDKFVSVVGPVFAGGDEGNILTLLTSLANVCRHDEGLLVTPTDVDKNQESTATKNKATGP